MKLTKFASLSALALLVVISVTEALSPTSFIARKTAFSDSALEDVLWKEPSSSKTSSIAKVSRGGDFSETVSTVRTAVTYYFDIIWTLAVSIFMIVWLKSKSLYDTSLEGGAPYADELPNFNKMVLKDGFCIDDKFLQIGTLKVCGLVDLLLVVGSYFFYKDRLPLENNKVKFYASAAYTLLHGSVHGFEIDQTGKIWDKDNGLPMNILGVFLLAAITSFTPIGINDVFKQAGKEGGLVAGVSAWIAFIALYVFGIKEKVYALTFINVTIYLSIFGARALVFPKDDERRLDFYSGRYRLFTILAATANIVVMCFEPLACKSWFAAVGGHAWFDVTLWLFMMSILK